MDFVILKVNGQDVSNSSHEDAVRCFQSAQEPIIVEVLRRHPSGLTTPPQAQQPQQQQQQPITTSNPPVATTSSDCPTTSTTSTSTTTATATSAIQQTDSESQSEQTMNGGNTFTLLVSTGVQTDWAGLIDDDDFVPVTLHADEQTNDSFDDILGHEIDFEEVTLRKTGSAEKLGLTVCYSSCSGSEDADTEVYISEIVPESLAAKDGRLREGDQILRVNGKDVANKEQTENLFAETKNSVTILVSRCLYTDDDYDDDRRLYNEGSPTISPEATTTPAYQNSMIEQLIRQQQEIDEQLIPGKETDSFGTPPPPIPYHNAAATAPPPAAFSDPSSSTCSSHSGSQKSNGPLEPEPPLQQPQPQQPPLQQPQQQQSQRKWMSDAVKECTRRVEGMSIGPKVVATQTQHQPSVKLAETYSSHVWSDTEHIYETIPESDSEPIYSSPYEHQHWIHQPNNNHLQNNAVVTQTTSNGKPWHSSSKSNSSGEEKDSSSAYNTGESCNSNTLTLELQQPSEHHRSTLVLCPPRATSTPTATSTPKMHCNCPVPLTPSSKFSKNQTSRRTTQQPQAQQPPAAQQQQQQQQQQQSSVLAAETMYTNVANLQQTMKLQQQLFKQALSRRKPSATRDSCFTRRSRTGQTVFQAPSLAQYQFVASHQVCGPTAVPSAASVGQQQFQSWAQNQAQLPLHMQQQSRTIQERGGDAAVQMEWKVKRRPDGTRYIARRPVRNRILRNRALRINEERQGHTTEDDAMSEIKIGRYWTKEERKKQLERAKERKQRQQELIQQQQQQTSEQLICEFAEDNKGSKKVVDLKKTIRKKPQLDDFTTVQEIIVHGNRVGSSNQNTTGKLMGLLSVTTV